MIVDIDCKYSSVVAITEDKQLYCWG